MLGGKSIANETVGDNSFGTNVSIEYKYLFNPDSPQDREAVVRNAYVPSKRKQAHIAPIDKLIRAALPRNVVDARSIENTTNPLELIEAVSTYGRNHSEICLLIGSVGSGKSTFTDYLRIKALPNSTASATEWVNVNLNNAPLSKDLIYQWVVDQAIIEIRNSHKSIDFDDLQTVKLIFRRELMVFEKGRASIFEKSSDRYKEILFEELTKLQSNAINVLGAMIDFVYKQKGKLFVIVLDNCDKRNREDQLLMFEVATWLKNSFPCIVFLPLRDTTYDQYRNEPPLDTVIKDLIFRIDPPLLDRVIQERLNYALREIQGQGGKFSYLTGNGIRVECSRAEVAYYLRSIIASLFQDQLFRRIISGLAGRNIRKGLEILLDFCKSGYIEESSILKIRTSNGDHQLPNHIIAKILLKGKRKYYNDNASNVKNLFSSEEGDPLPDPFVRVAILQWLKNRWRKIGPNGAFGFHQASSLISDLQALGHSKERLLEELDKLISFGCVSCEAQTKILSPNDLISIAPSGQIHLDLLKNINYLSSISEDVLFRENQPAKKIAENISGRGAFKADTRQTAITNSQILLNYLVSYRDRFFVGPARVVDEERLEAAFNIDELKSYVSSVGENDFTLQNLSKIEIAHPIGSEAEGQIVSIQNYGIFVDFGLTGRGLVHKTKFGSVKLSVIDGLEAGDWVIVKVGAFHHEKNRHELTLLGLSNRDVSDTNERPKPALRKLPVKRTPQKRQFLSGSRKRRS